MTPEDEAFDAPTDPEELKARLYGIVVVAEGGEEWYWDDPKPQPMGPMWPPISTQPAPESPPAEKK